MSEDIAVVMATLEAEGLIERVDPENSPGGYKVTLKGESKGYGLWMKLSGEDRILLILFLRKVKLI